MTDTAGPSGPIAEDELRGTLMERLGIELDRVSAELTTGHMPVAGNTQPAGILHGGASAALAETLASVAAKAHAGPGVGVAGVDLNVTNHRAVAAGWVRGEATALHLGRSTASYQIVITDDDGRRVCTGRLTCMILTGRPSSGPGGG